MHYPCSKCHIQATCEKKEVIMDPELLYKCLIEHIYDVFNEVMTPEYITKQKSELTMDIPNQQVKDSQALYILLNIAATFAEMVNAGSLWVISNLSEMLGLDPVVVNSMEEAQNGEDIPSDETYPVPKKKWIM